MRPLILLALAGLLAFSSALQAADVKPIVVNPSTGLNTTMQPGMRLSVPTASGGFLVTQDAGVQTATRVFSYPVLVSNDTLVVLGLPQTFTAKITFPASTTGASSINLPAGAAPTSPVNGDMWTTTAGLFAQINGSTVGPFSSNAVTGSLTAPRIPFASGASTLVDSGGLTYSTVTGLHSNVGTGSQTFTAGDNAGNATMTGASNTIVGVSSGHALTIGNFNTVIGQGSYLNATDAGGNIVIGTGSGNSNINSSTTPNILIGNSVNIDAGRFGALVIGSSSTNITDAFIGNGIANASAGNITYHGTGGSGANNPGGQFIVAGGQGTGTALGGAIVLQTSPVGVSSSNPNNLVEIARVSPVGNVLIGTTTDPAGTKGLSVSGETFTSASTTTRSGLNIAPGAAPTAPADGDFWLVNATGFFGRVNGATVGPFGAGGGSGFPVSTTTYAVQDATTATKQQKWDLASATASTILTLKGQQSTSQTLAFPNITGADTVATLGLGNAFTGTNTFTTATIPVAITAGAATAVAPPTHFSFTSAADTSLTNGSIGTADVLIDLSQTKQWGGNTTVTGYQSMLIKHPVLASTTATTTFSAPVTLTIDGPPTAGTNATVSGGLAFNIVSGNFQVQAGNMVVKGAPSLVTLTQSAASSGQAQGFLMTGAAHTGQTAGVNDTQFALNFGQTIQHATGAITVNDTALITAGTLTAVGASTVTDASTFSVSGPPTISTNLTATNQPSAIWAKAGQIRTDGNFMATPGSAPAILQDGQQWNDSTQLTHVARLGGVSIPLTGTICTTSTAGTVANSSVETSLFGTLVGTKTLPANFFKPGKTIRVHISGIAGSTGTPNLTLKLKLGSLVIVASAATGIPSLGTNCFDVVASMVCLTTGVSGTVQGTGIATIATASVSAPLVMGMPNGSASTVDTTASQVIDFTATWNAASPSNTITGFPTVEVLN